MSTKNIILCADGTGNRGGETPDTNVYRMYNAVDRHRPKRGREQITFYDNGVGTSTNKYIKAVTGALGFGFGQNIRDLYEFLARNYNEGDIVYLFGFSRGAATVRVFGGMLQQCGLIDQTHEKCQTQGKFDYAKFVGLIDDAFSHYKRKQGQAFQNKPFVINEVRIKFMGIWDTVPALGFPNHRLNDSWHENILERPLPAWLLRACDEIFDFGPLAHKFYNFTPSEIVDHVYHAIAIDDERKSFLPRVWDESDGKANVTQVWFAGMHSDVGGSYNQTGLAYETMVWMMERAGHHGLDFVDGALQDAEDKSHEHGKLHNSRDGLTIFYRYAPRNIEALCTKSDGSGTSKLKGQIKIHQSVINRMIRATDRYAPGLLPTEFNVVDSPIANKNDQLVAYGLDSKVDPHVIDPPREIPPENKPSEWVEDRQKVATVVRKRRILYRVFADYSFFIAVGILFLWNTTTVVAPSNKTGFWGQLDALLKYFLPTMFDAFIQEAIIKRPIIIVLVIGIFYVLFKIRTKWKKDTVAASVSMREKLLTAYNTPRSNLSDGDEDSDLPPSN
jgi:hypothetical protein